MDRSRTTHRGRVLALAAMLALALVLPASAVAQRDIVGGQQIGIAQAPWQVAVVDTSHYGSAQQFCGGSILDATHVITAAHCVLKPNVWSADVVYAGTSALSSPQQVAPVSARTIHPAYSSSSFANDVAVLTLSSPLSLDGTSARAVELAESSPAPGSAVMVSGWGDMTNGGGMYPNSLRAVTVHTVSDASCNAVYGGLPVALMLCAGEPEGSRDSCAGDSGGPLVNDGTNVLVGVVSFGYECALPGYPGVYTEVAASSIRSFILSFASGTAAPVQPTEQPAAPHPAPSPGPPPAPTTPMPVTHADTTSPTAVVRWTRCARTRCTVSLRVSDPGYSDGPDTLTAKVRSRPSACPTRRSRNRSCTQSARPRTLHAAPTGATTYRLDVSRLAAGATATISLVATDRAGNRQPTPTVLRLRTARN